MCVSFELDTLILQVVCPRSMMTQLSNFECLLNWIVSLINELPLFRNNNIDESANQNAQMMF